MGKRRRSRELAVQVLFHLGINGGDPSAAFDLICEHFDASESIAPFARMLSVGVHTQQEELDGLIQRASKNWRLERMPLLDKSILRLSVYEMLYIRDIPPKVSIDEAVELGKRFGTEESGSFINGVLDNILGTLLGEGRIPPENENGTQDGEEGLRHLHEHDGEEG